MPTIKIVNQENQPSGELALSDKVFGTTINQHLIWEAINSHLANKRRGTHSTKTRGEVSGGGVKPWKQKGTGRARAGSNRSPLWYKGGITFGPKPRDYSWEMPKKMRRQAVCSALSAKLKDNEMVVLEDLTLNEIKTKAMVAVLKNLNLEGKITFVLGEKNDTIRLSGRNITNLKILNSDNINTYDLINCDNLLMTKAAVTKIEETFGK